MIDKKEFVRRLAKKGYSLRDAKMITEDVLMTIMEIMAEGDGVHFVGFGTFCVKLFKSKRIRTPQGEEKMTRDINIPKFIPASSFKRAVNEGFVRK